MRAANPRETRRDCDHVERERETEIECEGPRRREGGPLCAALAFAFRKTDSGK